MHASTFGGNPVAARAGLATLETIERENLLDNVQAISEIFRERLETLKEKCELIRQVRILGLMIGIELAVEGAPLVNACLERNLLVNCTQSTVIRLLPAMNLSEAQATEGCDILSNVLIEHAESPTAETA